VLVGAPSAGASASFEYVFESVMSRRYPVPRASNGSPEHDLGADVADRFLVVELTPYDRGHY
jgi:hypothetical protein